MDAGDWAASIVWDGLMDAARIEAGIREKRVRVSAVLNSERAIRSTGRRWSYIIQCDPDCEICRG